MHNKITRITVFTLALITSTLVVGQSATATSCQPKTLTTALEPVVATYQRKTGDEFGVAVQLQTRGFNQPSVTTANVGQWVGGYAWSTSKVPIAIAALRLHPTPQNYDLARLSITQSNNDANTALANSIEPKNAMGQRPLLQTLTNQVLRQCGDAATSIDLEYTGLTQWTLKDQATFMIGLQRLQDQPAQYVRTLMSQIGDKTGYGHFGLANIPGLATKSGWGDWCLADDDADPANNHEDIRQMGYTTVHTNKQYEISIAIGTSTAINGEEIDDAFLTQRTKTLVDPFAHDVWQAVNTYLRQNK
ncbi:MAG: hypothetical protein LBT80_06330 [Lactobacillaceae bacterium]|jgi:hypothetical protein|nr:hypothetical protein [Lactobacillaceae bacterium]